MAKTKFQIFINNLHSKIENYQEQGMEIFYSATFITGKEKVKLVDRAQADLLGLVAKNLKYENPDKVRFELFNGKDAAHPLWLKEFMFREAEQATVLSNFQGFGEAEINRMVDDRFQERVKDAEFEELKHRVEELTQENQELQNSLDEMEDKTEKLEQELEGKKQIKYYAGMLGDILESFGINKDRIKKPIAELMGITDGDEKPKQIAASPSDQSGIVDEAGKKPAPSTEEQKRSEIIALISEYLRTTSNQTLANVFSIFSEIEQDNTIAGKVIQFINTLKTKENGNV